MDTGKGENVNRTEEYFDEQFISYDEEKGNGWGMNWRAYMSLRVDVIFQWFASLCKSRRQPSILEIGCASGDFTAQCDSLIKNCGGKIHGLDISARAVDICSSRFQDCPECSFSVGRLPHLDFQEKYDVILCMDVMEYFDVAERDLCYNNLSALLAAGGVILLQMPLQGEEMGQVIDQVKQHFLIKKMDYVYGKLWYDFFEARLHWMVRVMYFKHRFFPVRWAGRMAYEVMRSRRIVSVFFEINKKYFPKKKSHIVMICENP